MLISTINYSKKLILFFAVLQSNKFLIIETLKQSFYFHIPSDIQIQVKNFTISFSYSALLKQKGLLTVQHFNMWIQRSDKISAKKLILKGLGLKANLITKTLLELKLGFSHIIRLEIPLTIDITILKNMILLESSDRVLLGNFVNTIRSLKTPDAYKGKGIWYKNETKLLKAVKKT